LCVLHVCVLCVYCTDGLLLVDGVLDILGQCGHVLQEGGEGGGQGGGATVIDVPGGQLGRGGLLACGVGLVLTTVMETGAGEGEGAKGVRGRGWGGARWEGGGWLGLVPRALGLTVWPAVLVEIVLQHTTTTTAQHERKRGQHGLSV
jgi:hypothetical protein